jgi:predicted Zn-dependent peptidase
MRASGQERFRRTPPLPDSLRELRLPEIESMSFPNGLTVAVTSRPGYPLVTLQLVILAGESDSPPNLPDVATLTARMMGRGARDVSAEDMEKMIEATGGDFSTSVTTDYTVFTFHVLAEYMDRALGILRLMILQAEFPELELASARRNFYYELLEKRKNAEFVGRRHLLHILFENHPYRTATYGEDVIKYITSKDIAAFYTRFYRPNNALLIASGAVAGPATAQRIGQFFAPWVSRDINRLSTPPPQPNNRERICLIDYPSAEDFVIFVGNIVMAPTSPDYYPVLVLNQVLGGTMASRLFMNLRESKGYAYDAFSEVEFFKSCGVYWARARVTPETIRASIQEILRELRSLATERIVPDEIERAKSFLIGNLPLKFASLEGYSEKLAQVVALGLGARDWNKAPDNLMMVNADRALEAAQKYYSPVPVIVIVGNREWAFPALNDFNVVELYDSSGALKMTFRKGVER